VTAELKKDDILYIGNPNNPTAVLTPFESIMKIYDRCCEVGAVLIIDEAFIDFLDDEREYTLRFEAVKRNNLIVLGSLTKFFAVPGLRLGYMAASKDNIIKFKKLLPTWRINSLAQIAGLASLKDKTYIGKTREYVKKERKFLIEQLEKINGLKYYDSKVNFILINCRETGKDINSLQNFLGSKGVLIRRCDTYWNLDLYYFRIAVKTRQDNQKLSELLKQFFTG
jgi:threonine-phosphate decarboxylase